MNKPSKYFDQHVHNHFSNDCSESIESYIDKALELGLDTISFTNHLDLGFCIGDFYFDFDDETDEINEIKKHVKNINIFHGIEVGYNESTLKETCDHLNSHSFNVINLSLHMVNQIDVYKKSSFTEYGIDTLLTLYFDEMVKMVKQFDNYDVLSHLDYAFKTAYLVDPSIKISKYEKQITEIFKTIILKGKSFEINTKVQSSINDDLHLLYLLKLYKSLGGIYLTLSSDAHNASHLCFKFDKYIQIIKQANFDTLSYYIERKRYDFKI